MPSTKDFRYFDFPGNTLNIIGTLLAGVCFHFVALVVYRLYIHPLAHFPGPKLAAATGWYEAFYQLFSGPQGGQFIFVIEELHKKYGPIVRVTPDELHFNDPEFYETVYSNGQNIDKPLWAKYQFGSPGTLFSAIDSETHRLRRSSLNPFFSKQKVLQQEETIRTQVEKLCVRLNEEFCGTSNILRADYMVASASCDIVADYAFGRSYNMLDAPKFMSPFIYSIDSFKKAGLINVEFPWLPKLVNLLPLSWLAYMMPNVVPSLQFKEAISEQIEIILQGKSGSKAQGTIFNEILNAKMPSEEMQLARLTDEAGGIVAAALETTKRSVCVMLFYVLSDPSILNNLRRELSPIMPDSTKLPNVSELEKLPYLMAVIQEGLRLGYGTVGRSPRINKSKTLQHGALFIPPGTPVSSSTYILHHNESVFPNSHTFDPERWLNDPTGPNGKKPLGRYLMSFSKGSRYCLGMQLAYAIMEVMLTALVMRYDLELYETTERDIVCTCDLTAAGVWEGSQGIRVLVKQRKISN